MSTLNNLPDVSAQGELFLPRPRVSDKRWDTDFAHTRYIEVKRNGPAIRPFSVYAYLNDLYRTPGSVGFKLMYAQLGRYPEILTYLIRHHIHVIHLVRLNHFDVLLSYAIKAKIGQAHLLAGESAPDQLRVDLDSKKLVRRMEWLQFKQNLARKMLVWCRLPHLEVAYEELLHDQSNFCLIQDFLAIDSGEDALQSNTVKIRRGGHREVVNNYEEVRHVLANSKFAGLLE